MDHVAEILKEEFFQNCNIGKLSNVNIRLQIHLRFGFASLSSKKCYCLFPFETAGNVFFFFFFLFTTHYFFSLRVNTNAHPKVK